MYEAKTYLFIVESLHFVLFFLLSHCSQCVRPLSDSSLRLLYKILSPLLFLLLLWIHLINGNHLSDSLEIIYREHISVLVVLEWWFGATSHLR